LKFVIFPMVQQPPARQGLLIIEASQLHSDTPHSVGLLWTSDQPDTEISKWQHSTRDRHPCPHAGFESAFPTNERLQTHALHRAATGIGILKFMFIISMNEQ